LDETVARRGHEYITLFVGLGAPGYCSPLGKDAGTVAAFAADLAAHGGSPQTVAEGDVG
jgi:transposase